MSDIDIDYEDDGRGVSWIAIAAVIAVVAAAVAFFAGRALAGGGPSTLSEAVKQAQAGDLPCGETGDAPSRGAADGAAGQGGPPAGGFGQGGAPNSDFLVRAVCAQDGGGQGAQPPGGGRGPGGFSTQVKSVEGSKLTLTGPQGDTTVELGPDTTVSRTTEGATSDLQPGQNVLVTGGRQGEPATSVLIVPGD